MAYRPMTPFNVPMWLLIPEMPKEQSYGVLVKDYPSVTPQPKRDPKKKNDPILIYGSFRSFGGTEVTSNGAYTVEDTATIETWYRPDIKADCRIVLADDLSAVYEIVGTPEDIEMRHQFLHIRVRRVKGGA